MLSITDLLHVDFCSWYSKCLICDNICLLTVSAGRRSLYWTRRKTGNHGTNYWRIPRNPYRKIWSPARSRILHGRWHIRGKYKFRISQILSFISKLTCLFYLWYISHFSGRAKGRTIGRWNIIKSYLSAYNC